MTQPAPETKSPETKSPERQAADLAKVKADTDKIAAETAIARQQLDLDARKAKAELDKLEADTRESLAKASYSELLLGREQRKEADELAKDAHHHRYLFNTAVTEASVNACIASLTAWSRQDPNCAVEIVFNSPGGSVVDGMALFDYIQMLRNSGHKVTTVALGMAASMAGILLQAGDVRAIGAQSWLMIHEASFGASGKTGEVEDRVEWVKRVQDRILTIFADRCASADSTTATKRLSRKAIKNRWHRKDFWVSADEALAFGLVDEIR